MKRYNKTLFVTVVETILTDKGREKLNKHKEEADEDSGGLSAEWYRENGVKPPIGLKDTDDDYIELEAEDTEERIYEGIFPARDFISCVNDDNDGSIICFRDGSCYSIVENSIEVFFQLDSLSTTWFERLCQNLKYKFRRNKKQEIQFIPE